MNIQISKQVAIILIFIGALCVLPMPAGATSQQKDDIYFEGVKYTMSQYPLYSLLGDRSYSWKCATSSSANWDNYDAAWEIRDQQLFLKSFTPCVTVTPVTISSLFPGRNELPVKADWYTGEITMYNGDPIPDPENSLLLVYPHSIVMTIEKGNVIGINRNGSPVIVHLL